MPAGALVAQDITSSQFQVLLFYVVASVFKHEGIFSQVLYCATHTLAGEYQLLTSISKLK